MRRPLLAFLLFVALVPGSRLKAQFTPGNIAVLVVNNGTLKGTSGKIVELTTTATTPQAAVTTTSLGNMYFSGSATSTGYIANSNDGTLLCVTGPSDSASNVNTVTARGVDTLDVNTTVGSATTYTGVSGEQSRCATTLDNTNYYIADQNGFYINGGKSPLQQLNYREIKAFGGTVYASVSNIIYTINTSTGTTNTALTTSNSSLTGFYLIQSGANGTTYDILYTVSESAENVGSIAKYSLVNGTWTANGTAPTTFGGYSIAAKTINSGTNSTAELYVSSGAGDSVNNSVFKCIDATGWNQNITITAIPTILYKAANNNSIKGIALVPTGTVTVTPPAVSLAVSTNKASEALQTVVTITATTSAAVTTAQTVTLAVSSYDNITSDYTLSGNTITIPAGQTTGTATFTVVNDNVTEGYEVDNIAISAVSSGLTIGAPSSQSIGIQDNDPSPTPVRITEYMYDGTDGEFIEFTNIGSTTISMNGWSYDDNKHTPGKVSLSAYDSIRPGQSVILTQTAPNTFLADWSLCSGQSVIGNNSENLGRDDQINLYDQNGTLVDRLTYGDDISFPGTIRTKGTSGVVTAAALGVDSIAGWILSYVGDAQGTVTSGGGDIGSPGYSIQATVHFTPCAVVADAPTITVDTVNTDVSLLGGNITASPSSPYAISGTINDPNDPAATKGIYFTIASTDPTVPVGNINVTVTSSNTAVVPATGVLLTGGAASYLLKIVPTGVGYSNITLTAANGSITTTYTILYAASQSASSSLVWHTGSSDASDGIALDSNYVAIGDDQINQIFIYNRYKPGLPQTTYDYTANAGLYLPDGASKQLDIEAATPSQAFNGRTYWFGSMSNSSSTPYPTEPNRDRIVAVNITGSVGQGTLAFSYAGYDSIRTALINWGTTNNLPLAADAASGINPKTISGFNVEGAVFAPDNTTLYFGFRAPLIQTNNGNMALIAPVQNFENWFQSPGTAATFGSPIMLDLGGRGIRDMIRLTNGTYVIAAGSYDGTLNPAIYTWSGNASDPAVAQPSFIVTGLNVEGLVGITNNDTLNLNQIQVITDNGSDIPYADNTENKDLTELNWQKFSTSVVTSTGDPLPTVFLTFTAARQGTGVYLDWTTGIPGSLTSFSVQRSTDGAIFTTVTTVTALAGQAGYSFVDQNAPATKVYYRIQANEPSGQTVLSTIRLLDASGANVSIQVYPNPVAGGVFTLIIPNAGLKTVNVYNSTGALIEQTTFGDTAKDFSTSGWAAGIYLLRIVLPDGSTTTTKLVIP